jgi:Ca-activated chloride channel family protein
VRQQLQDSVVGLAGRETALGDALALAVKRLQSQPPTNAS